MAVTVDCWAVGSISFNGLFFGDGILMDDWKRQTLLLVFLMDLVIYCGLALYSDEFGDRDE